MADSEENFNEETFKSDFAGRLNQMLKELLEWAEQSGHMVWGPAALVAKSQIRQPLKDLDDSPESQESFKAFLLEKFYLLFPELQPVTDAVGTKLVYELEVGSCGDPPSQEHGPDNDSGSTG